MRRLLHICRRLPYIYRNALSCIAIVATGALYGQQAQPVASVLDVHGNWQLEGQSEPVKVGQALYAGSSLSTARYNYDNSITLVQHSDASRTRIACENSPNNPCAMPFVIKSSEAPPKTQVSSLIAAAFRVLVAEGPAIASHAVSTIGRGKYVVAEREDVVSLEGGKGLSLTGRIPLLPAGSYSVDAAKSEGGTPPITARIDTATDDSWQSSLSISSPGLYSVSVRDSDGELRAHLVLLFVGAADYDTARQKFDTVRNRADTWQGVSAQNDEHTLLRAVLQAMSGSS